MIVNGNRFQTVGVFIRQAQMLRFMADHLKGFAQFRVFGDGLLPAYLAPSEKPRILVGVTAEQHARLQEEYLRQSADTKGEAHV